MYDNNIAAAWNLLETKVVSNIRYDGSTKCRKLKSVSLKLSPMA
jgi:hypothetical protein